MATYNELEQRIDELKARTGRASISPSETFGIMDELLDKLKGVDMNAASMSIQKTYTSLAAMNADPSPVDDEGRPLKVGQLVTVVNGADSSENAIYRWLNPGWEKAGDLGDLSGYAKTGGSEKTVKEVETEIAQLAGDMGEITGKIILPAIEQGSIAGASGANVASENRIRTKDYYKVNSFQIKINDDFSFNVYYYDSNYGFIRKQTEGWLTTAFSSAFVGFVKIVVVNKNDPNSPITPDVVTGLELSGVDSILSKINDKMGDLQNFVFRKIDVIPEMEQGTLNSVSGLPTSNNTRIRTKDFYSVSGFAIDIGTDYSYEIFEYDDDENYISNVFETWNSEPYVSNHRGKVRIVVVNRSDPNSPITPNAGTDLKFTIFSDNISNLEKKTINIEKDITTIGNLSAETYAKLIQVVPDSRTPVMERGSILGSDGQNSSTGGNTRIRTKGYYSVEGYTIKINPEFGYHLFHYNAEGIFIKRITSDFINTTLKSDFKGIIRLAIANFGSITTEISTDANTGLTIETGFSLRSYIDEQLEKTQEVRNPNTHMMFFRSDLNVVAHRGVWVDGVAPENSPHAVFFARKYGFKVIECDVRKTKDGQFVIMHDASINRTMRNADYSSIADTVLVANTNFQDLRDNYMLISSIQKYRTKIPTLEEFLISCKDNGIFPIVHIIDFNFVDAIEIIQLHLGDNWGCFSELMNVCVAARELSNCLVLYNKAGLTPESAIAPLDEIGGWCGYSSTNINILTPELCSALRKKGYEIQASTLNVSNALQAVRNGVTMLLSDHNINLRNSIKAEEVYSNYDFSDFTTDGTVVNRETLQLNYGQKLSKTWAETIEYGGIDVEINYIGKINININGANYTGFTRSDNGFDRISLRFYNKTPSITITAVEDNTAIMDVVVRVAKF